MSKFNKYDRFIVVDTNCFVRNETFVTDDSNKAFDIAFTYIKHNLKDSLNCYGIVIYCCMCPLNTYPEIRTFVSLGEIVENMIKNGTCSKQEILDFDLTELRKAYV